MNKYSLLIILLFFLSACARLSPEVIQAGGNDYNVAIQSTNNEQLLLNLIRLKYRDTPFFLQVNSVSSQFRLFSEAGINANFQEQQIPESVGLSGGFNFTEQPTVTYLPLHGNDFIQQLLAPISLENIILLANSGWSIERILRLTVKSMNGIPNAPTASGPTPSKAPTFKTFHEAVNLLRRLQSQAKIQFAYTADDNKKTANLLFSHSKDSDIKALQRLLHLDEADSYPLLVQAGNSDRTSISLSTRSLLGVMYYLSHATDVPDADKTSGKVTITTNEAGQEFDWATLTAGLFQIKSSTNPSQQDVAIGTNYRGSWFYIDDSDLESKTTFSLLTQLFSLQSGDAEGITPVLTLPVGN